MVLTVGGRRQGSFDLLGSCLRTEKVCVVHGLYTCGEVFFEGLEGMDPRGCSRGRLERCEPCVCDHVDDVDFT